MTTQPIICDYTNAINDYSVCKMTGDNLVLSEISNNFLKHHGAYNMYLATVRGYSQ